MTALTKPCTQCPWRLANQGKRHFGSFYSKKNLNRLWNQVRGGGNQQSCHLTDPSHPDHVVAGAKTSSTPQECPGSLILIIRELKKIEKLGDGVVTVEAMKKYSATRRKGITKHGMLYWLVARVQFAGVKPVGGLPIPNIPDDEEIGLPEELREA